MTDRTEHRGWHTPRKLPHFDSAETTHAVTFRLADSLPRAIAEARRDESDAVYRRRIELALDSGLGACWLARHEIARVVEAVLRARDDEDYDLHAYVVMPNHVHALITQRNGSRLADIVQAWKSVSAKTINDALARTGRVWQRDYYDRFMRDDVHFERTRGYIESNPVSAGLVGAADEWPFSSRIGAARR